MTNAERCPVAGCGWVGHDLRAHAEQATDTEHGLPSNHLDGCPANGRIGYACTSTEACAAPEETFKANRTFTTDCGCNTYPCDCTGCDCDGTFHLPGPHCPGQPTYDEWKHRALVAEPEYAQLHAAAMAVVAQERPSHEHYEDPRECALCLLFAHLDIADDRAQMEALDA
jgi:hypothetical protein